MVFKPSKISIENLLTEVKNLSASIKISEISKYFLDIPYKNNSLIGSSLEKEQLVIDFEGVDCMTFIEYVEALRLSDDYVSFIENLKYVRYFEGIVDFKKRRHFFTDWRNLTTLKDITNELTKKYFKTVVKELNRNEEKLWIDGLEIKQRIINYIPSEYIEKIASELKTGDYCGFYTSKKGLDVIHVGIVLVDSNIKLRHASSQKNNVVDEDFITYSKEKEGIIIFRPKEKDVASS